MESVPHRRRKALIGASLLLLLAGLLFYGYKYKGKESNSLAGLDPAAVQDEREVEIKSLLGLLKTDKEDYKTHAELARLYYQLAEYSKALPMRSNRLKSVLEKRLIRNF